MKKFAIFALTLIIAFAMCSCQPTTENFTDKVSFTVGTYEKASKAITATGTELEVIDHIELKFTAVNQSLVDVEGQSTDWEEDLIVWDKDNPTASTNGTWNSTKEKWLTQGQWKIEARAVNEDSSNVFYYGYVQVYASKRVNTAKITLLPVESTEKGTLKFEAITSNAPFAEDEMGAYKLVYTVFDITGAKKDTFEVAVDSSVDDVVTFLAPSDREIAQGAYTITAEVFENVSTTATADWKSAGGCVTDVVIMAGAEATVKGEVLTSEYINMNPTTSVDIASSITVGLEYADGKFTASADIEEGSTVVITGYRWYKWNLTTGYEVANKTSSADTDTWAPSLTPGDYEIAVVAYGTETVEGNTIDVQSDMVKARYHYTNGAWEGAIGEEQGK